METVFLGSGNWNTFRLRLGDTIQDLSSETRFVIDVDGITIDSSVNPSYFDWDTDPTYLKVRLSELAVTEGFHAVEFRSYNPIVSPYFSWGLLNVNFI